VQGQRRGQGPGHPPPGAMAVDLPKLAVVLAGSLAVLLQTLAEEKAHWDFYWIWALCVSCASTLACAPALLVATCRPPGPEEAPRGAPLLFLTALWTAGASVMTMERPFALTGNGYFGSWAALVSSWLMCFASYASLREPLERLPSGGGQRLAVLLLASLAALAQTAYSCGTVPGWCNGNAAWVIVCSAVSTALCGTLLLQQVAEKMEKHFRLVALFFLVWWSAGAVVTTFESPYDTSYSNGYFSCWAAVAASLLMVEGSWEISVSDGAITRASEAAGGAPQEVVVLCLASLVALVASSVHCAEVSCGDLERWAITCSAASLALCFAVLVYTVRGGWITGGVTVRRMAVALLVWWVVGAGCMTLASPFHRLSNGYFAAWVALASAYLFTAKNVESLSRPWAESGAGGREVGAVFLASGVLLAQAISDCASGACGGGGRVWALLCSSASLFVCLAVSVCTDRMQAHFKFISAALLFWWTLGVATLTFHTPYVRTGNGYFACWCAWGASGSLFLLQFPQLKGYANLGGLGAPTPPPDEKPPEAVLDTEALPQAKVAEEALAGAEGGAEVAPVVLGSPFGDTAM